jgi:hypothetical protein
VSLVASQFALSFFHFVQNFGELRPPVSVEALERATPTVFNTVSFDSDFAKARALGEASLLNE